MEKRNRDIQLEGTYYEDEIDLVDLIKVLYKNKLLIMLITIILTVTGVIVALNLSKEYEVEANVTSDQQVNFKFYHNNKEFTDILVKKFELDKINLKSNEKLTDSDYRKIINGIIFLEPNREINGYTIKAKSDEAEKTYDYLNIYISELKNYIRESLFDDITKNEEFYINDIEETLVKMKLNIEKVKTESDERVQVGDQVYSIELSELKALTIAYENSLAAYKSILQSKSRLKESKIINIINIDDIPRYPVKPNKRLLVLISMVLGGFVGVFVAFVREFFKQFDFKKFKEELNS